MQMLPPLPRGVFNDAAGRSSQGDFDAFAQVGGDVEVLAVEKITVGFLEVATALNFTEAKLVLIQLGGSSGGGAGFGGGRGRVSRRRGKKFRGRFGLGHRRRGISAAQGGAFA